MEKTEQIKVSIVGDVFGTSGFSNHARQFATALQAQGISVGIETNLPRGWELNCSNELRRMLDTDNRKEIVIMITSPLWWPIRASDRPKKLIGFLVFEGSKIPTAFLKPCEIVDLIFVPSKHTKQAAVNAGINPDKIKVIGEGVDAEIFKPTPPISSLISNKFTFVFNKGWAKGKLDRSGFHIALQAFVEEFKKEEPVRFLAHINPVYGGNVHQMIGSLGLDLKNSADVAINSDIMPFQVLSGFYCAGDVFLSPHKSEGWGLNICEAMACGLPAICTKYGGNLDYCNEENSYFIDYDLKPASDPDLIYEESKWAEPKIEDLKKQMRYVFEHQEEVKSKGVKAMREIKQWDWEKSAKLAKQEIMSIVR